MKAYVITTGVLFGLIVVAHVWRFIAEGAASARDPVFIIFTILAAALTLWAWRVLRSLPPGAPR